MLCQKGFKRPEWRVLSAVRPVIYGIGIVIALRGPLCSSLLGLLSILHEIVCYAFIGLKEFIPNRIGWPVIALDRAFEALHRCKLLRQRLGELIGMGGVGIEALQ